MRCDFFFEHSFFHSIQSSNLDLKSSKLMKCRINAKKQLRQFENIMLKIVLQKLSRTYVHTHTHMHAYSQRCRSPKTKRNSWIGQHWIYVFCNPSCWLINELPLPPPSVHPRHTIVVTLWMGSLCSHYQRTWRKRNERKKSGLPVRCAATRCGYIHNRMEFSYPPKNVHTHLNKMNAPRDCQNNASTSNWLAMNLL